MEIIKGKVQSAKKLVVYGPEGIGKSTFASKFPSPLFIDTEGSTKELDVARTPRPTSWPMLLEQVDYVKTHPGICKTLIIDTADWAEHLCIDNICAKKKVTGIEDFGYGKGYVYLEEDFGRLLNKLEDLVASGVHVVFTAHSQMRKFEQPDELGAYDRWELKLEKKTSPLLKEWADIILFANYSTQVINVDDQGAVKGKNKVQGGKRVMYTLHHPCWDAKNRNGLDEKLPFDYGQISHLFEGVTAPKQTPPPAPAPSAPAPAPAPVAPTPPPVPATAPVTPAYDENFVLPFEDPALPTELTKDPLDDIPVSLRDLMQANGVSREEIQQVVSTKGYYPANTPISHYDPKFVAGVLVGAWAQVHAAIKAARK